MFSIQTRFAIHFCLFFSLLFISCGGSHHPKSTTPTHFVDVAKDEEELCKKNPGTHEIFSVIVDGADVGREVRTSFLDSGPAGAERVIVSHLVKNEKMGNVLFQTTNVRTERTHADSGKLVRASFVKKDQVNVSSVEITFKKDTFHRVVSSRSSFSGPLSEKKDSIPLKGDELVGYRLSSLLRQVSLKKKSAPLSIRFFEPQLNAPVTITISPPTPGTLTVDAQEIDGNWIDLRKEGSNQVVSRSFYDEEGTLWAEQYPELHESRQRMTDSLSLPSETSELIVGLRSKTYIYDPSIATRATYHLESSPDKLDALSLLEEPLNHDIKRESPTKIVLEVEAGSPDKDDPPRPEDLGSSFYIKPQAPSIVQALKYLRSSGKRGNLIQSRKLNATSVIARASLIRNPASFWKDPEKVAGLMMRYVGALLPDKRHTFSMADAVETLSRGAGDCTEHSVLFASLMRAHGIPTRLITGMFLTRGGIWAYHMWASFWDGYSWHSIDPSTMIFKTGALHVALGRGASVFKDIRDRLADFMWRTFNGVSFDLVAASNFGEKLFLARPSNVDQDLSETALFNAVVLSDRGEHSRALTLLDKNISKDSRSLGVKLMRIELLFNGLKFDEALDEISSLRKETSDVQNTELLDKLELKCLLKFKRFDEASSLYDKLVYRYKEDTVERLVLESEYLFGLGREKEAIEFAIHQLASHPDETKLHALFSNLVSKTNSKIVDDTLLSKALNSSWRAARESWYVDHFTISTLSRLLSKSNNPFLSHAFLNHALVLAPKEPTIVSLRETLKEHATCSNND